MGYSSDSQTTRSERNAKARGLSRRKWLAVSGAGLAGLAGCMGGDESNGSDDPDGSDGSDGSNGSDGSDTPVDAELTRFQGKIPTDFNWNYFITNFKHGVAAQLFHRIRPPEMTTLEEWDYDSENNVRRWTLPENLTWWNGDPVTAEDEYVKAEITRLQAPETSPFESIELEDDYTLAWHYKEPQNPTVVRQSNALGDPIAVPRWKFQSWLEQYQDATTQDERDSITEELQQETISTQTVIDEGLGNHPYEMTEVNEQEMVFELRTDHPWATEDQVKTVRTRTITEDSQIIINQDEIDLGGGLLAPNFSGPDHIENIIEMPSLQMSKVMFNHQNEHLQKRNVRRAITHLLDAGNIIQNQSPNAMPVSLQTGMGDEWVNEWLGEDFASNLHKYPTEADPDGATQLLEEEGYSKSGGTWQDPDGNAVEFSILSTNWGAFVDGARTTEAQLRQFGFETDFQALEHGSFTSRAWDNMEHDLTFYYQNNWANHPVSYYRPHYPGGLRMAQPDTFREDIEGWLEAGEERSPFNGLPLTPTIPSETGALEVSGSGEQINLFELWDGINKAQNEEQTVENLRKLARYWNYDMPHFVALQMRGGWWGDTKDFNMPVDNEELQVYGSNDVALRNGYIKYKYE